MYMANIFGFYISFYKQKNEEMRLICDKQQDSPV